MPTSGCFDCSVIPIETSGGSASRPNTGSDSQVSSLKSQVSTRTQLSGARAIDHSAPTVHHEASKEREEHEEYLCKDSSCPSYSSWLREKACLLRVER